MSKEHQQQPASPLEIPDKTIYFQMKWEETIYTPKLLNLDRVLLVDSKTRNVQYLAFNIWTS